MSSATRTPWITLVLVAIGIPVGYAVYWVPDLIVRFGFDPAKPTLLTAFTSLFLHANALHLLGNMLAITAVGSWVEQAAGWKRFLAIYFLSGFIGVAVHWAVLRNSSDPAILIGASGCAAGMTAYGTIRYMWSRVALGPKLRVPVVVMGGIWIVLQVVGALVLRDKTGGVSFWAHAGGAVGGLIMAVLFGASSEADFHRSRKAMSEMGERSPGAQLAAAQAHLKSHPADAVAWREVAEAQRDLDHLDESLDAWLQVYRHGSSDARANAVHALDQGRSLGRLEARERSRAAHQMVESQPDAAATLWRSVAEDADDAERPFALLALAIHFPQHSGAAAVLARDFPLHEATETARRRGLLQ